MKLMLLALLMPMLSFAQFNSWKDNVDGLDMWEIEASEAKVAIENFKTKCASEVIERSKNMMEASSVSSSDFTFSTRVHSKIHEGYGKSYYCELKVIAAKNSPYNFSRPLFSPDFFDIIDPDTREVIKTNVEQCKEFSHDLEARAQELRIFNRHALLKWKKNPRNGKFVEACYVKYTKLLQRK